jgi:hypothetical protein
MRLWGDHEFLWKCWLLPLAAILVWALHALLRRFAEGVEMPLLWMTLLSPAILPSFNFMLDLPALGLSLAAVACFLKAVDDASYRRAVLAGIIGGLAMQTKYTGVTSVAVMCAHGLLWGRWRLAFVAGAAASLIFIGWEAAIYARYGSSTFLNYAAFRGDFSEHRKEYK